MDGSIGTAAPRTTTQTTTERPPRPVLSPAEARRAREEFHGLLVALLPKLRVQALALTRNRAAAEDLVQDAVANALAAQDSFTPGTNFAAWMHRILRNRFISTLRKQRETTDIEDLRARSSRCPPRMTTAWCSRSSRAR